MKNNHATAESQAFLLQCSQALPFPAGAPPTRTPVVEAVGGVVGGRGSSGGADWPEGDPAADIGPSGSTRLVNIETSGQFEALLHGEIFGEDTGDNFCHSNDSENQPDFEDTWTKPKRRDRWKSLKNDVSGFLTAAEWQRETAEKCGRYYDVFLHKQCGARVGVLWSCRNRWCPDCFRKWASAAAGEIRAAILGMKAPKHLVLSIRAAGLGELRAGWKLLDESFRRLRHAKLWKEKVRGYIVARGLTFSRGRWHVHLHLAIDADYIPHLELKAAWVKATKGAGGPAGVQINRARDRAGLALELVKGTKGDFRRLRANLRGRPVLWGELVLACRGLRWYSPGGRLPAKPERPPCCCPRCGGPFERGQWESFRLTAEEYSRSTFGPLWKDYFDYFARGSPGPDDPPIL